MDTSTSNQDPARDFDFLVGSWTVKHRKLTRRLAGSSDWIEFEGTTVFRTMLTGLANIDENLLNDPAGSYRALTFRTYSPEHGKWSIYWVDGRNPRLDPPVHGRFDGGVGAFFGNDTFGDLPIRVRFLWTRSDDDHAHWEQAFSADDGKTWETNWTMDFTRVMDARQWCGGTTASECKILELRMYTTQPGKREELARLFDQHFIEPQEAAGMAVLGQFRDLEDPNRYVWLRGFAGMNERINGLATFYSGPTWRTYRDQANATMADSDNVLLLRPAWPGAELDHRISDRPNQMSKAEEKGFTDITIFSLNSAATPDLIEYCKTKMATTLSDSGASSTAWYVTEASPNNFPKLPIREGEHVLVGIASFTNRSEFESFVSSGAWQRDVAPGLAKWIKGVPEVLHLEPTRRSAYRALPSQPQ